MMSALVEDPSKIIFDSILAALSDDEKYISQLQLFSNFSFIIGPGPHSDINES